MKLFSLAVNRLNRTRTLAVAGVAAAVLAVGLAGAAQAAGEIIWEFKYDNNGTVAGRTFTNVGWNQGSCFIGARPQKFTDPKTQTVRLIGDSDVPGTFHYLVGTGTTTLKPDNRQNKLIKGGPNGTYTYDIPDAKLDTYYAFCFKHDAHDQVTCSANGTFCGHKFANGKLQMQVVKK
jgi:hypothetical protein